MARLHVSTQDTLAREHVVMLGTLAREHVFSTQVTQFSRLISNRVKTPYNIASIAKS